ncbi:hypothetical protein VPH35_112710 [Triticum aestivum]
MTLSSAQPQRLRRDWADLDAGPAGLVAEHVLGNDILDLVRFRVVCKVWRACSAHLRAEGVLDRRFHPRRWIMLPKAYNNSNGWRRFLNVFTGESIHRGLPDLAQRCPHVLGTTSEGLILQLGTDVGQLLNPLTGQVVGLPSAATLLSIAEFHYEQLFELSLYGAGLAADDTVVIHFRSFSIAVAKPCDERWTHIRSQHRITSLLPFKGRVYCATSRNILLVETQTNGANQPPQLVVAAGHKLQEGEQQIPRECNVSVYRVDLDAENTVPLHGLDGKTLFLGRKRRLLLVATEVSPSINAETAYLCWLKPKDDADVYGIDLFGGGRAEPKFKKGDVAYYLSCFVSYSCSEYF